MAEQSKKPKIKCQRCGLCCFYWKLGRRVKCRHLRYNRRTKKTYCKIYTKRKFMLENGDNPVIDFYFHPELNRRTSVICVYREHRKENFEGCLYNKKEWKNEKEV